MIHTNKHDEGNFYAYRCIFNSFSLILLLYSFSTIMASEKGKKQLFPQEGEQDLEIFPTNQKWKLKFAVNGDLK